MENQMDQGDFANFTAQLTALSEIYGKSLSTAGVGLYWAILKDYSWSDIEKAFKTILKSHKYPTMPTPAHFIECIIDTDVAAIQAVNELKILQIAYGPDVSLEIDDPAMVATIKNLGGWVAFNDKLHEANDFDHAQLIRDFRRLYAHHIKNRTVPSSMKLIGRTEVNNIAHGWQEGTTLRLPDGSTMEVRPKKVSLKGPAQIEHKQEG
jgi:hypothetical protein